MFIFHKTVHLSQNCSAVTKLFIFVGCYKTDHLSQNCSSVTKLFKIFHNFFYRHGTFEAKESTASGANKRK